MIGSHFAGSGFAQAKPGLVGRHWACGGHVNLFVEHGLGESCGAQGSVDVREAEAVNGQIGRGVVAEDNHEVQRVAEGEA